MIMLAWSVKSDGLKVRGKNLTPLIFCQLFSICILDLCNFVFFYLYTNVMDFQTLTI